MVELSVVILTLNEAGNIGTVIRQIKDALASARINFELIIIDGGSRDDTVTIAQEMGATVKVQSRPGFGEALLEGFRLCSGSYILTLDADLSHPASVILELLKERGRAAVVVASRYVRGGKARMSFFRYGLSRVLNFVFQYGLSLPVRDNTSGFRLYKREVVESLHVGSSDFSILPEIMLAAYSKGWAIKEVPFTYLPRKHGSSHLRLVHFALSYIKVFFTFWRRRNSIQFADYDERAYYSKIFLQRYWQRKRYAIIMELLGKGEGMRIADLGCGSSKIIQDLRNAIAVDLSMDKLRYISKSNRLLVNAALGALPLKNAAVDCVICSEVIEHTKEESIFDEMNRILAPGGVLILGTPDYASLR